jgi:hypothetical protein
MVELRNKGRWRRKLWVLLGCGIAAVLILTLWREREPRYQERSLTQWAALLNHIDSRDEFQLGQQAEDAIRHIGTNAMPFLLRWIQYKEQPWRTRLGVLCDKLPEKVGGSLSRVIVGRGHDRQGEAFSALYVLGPDAKAAIPVLTNIIASHGFFTQSSLAVLAHIGDEGLPPLLDTLTNPASPDRLLAVITLESDDAANFIFNSDVEFALIGCLDDPDPELAMRAAGILCCHNVEKERVLGKFMEALVNSENDKRLRHAIRLPLVTCLMGGFSISTLMQFLQDTNSPLSSYAAGALGEMAQRGAPLRREAFESLMYSLYDPRSSVRNTVAFHIDDFPEFAELAVPALLDCWSDPDDSVRQVATNAIFRMPEFTILKQIDELDKNGHSGLSLQAKMMWFERYGGGPPGPALARLLEHPDPRIRQMATNAFQTLRGSNVVNQTAENTSH